VNLLKLRYFQSVCVNKSVSAAAEELHISQPSLSACIKELEAELGVTLFLRQHKGMALTEEGEVLYRLSSSLLDHADQVKRTMLDLGNGKKVLRLGVPPMIGSIMLPKIYGDFLPKNPNVELQITESGRRELINLIQADRLDMAIIPHDGEIESEFESVSVMDFEIVCCARQDSQLVRKTKITPNDLKDKNVVLFKNSFFQTEQIKRWFARYGVEPKILLQTDQLSTLTNIITHGEAVGFMFRQLIEEKSELALISMKEPMNVKVSLIWKRNTNVFKTMKSFATYVKAMKK